MCSMPSQIPNVFAILSHYLCGVNSSMETTLLGKTDFFEY